MNSIPFEYSVSLRSIEEAHSRGKKGRFSKMIGTISHKRLSYDDFPSGSLSYMLIGLDLSRDHGLSPATVI